MTMIRHMVELSELDVRVLRALSSRVCRTPEAVAGRVGAHPDVVISELRRLRGRTLVEDDGERPQRWLRTIDGDVALEFAP